MLAIASGARGPARARGRHWLRGGCIRAVQQHRARAQAVARCRGWAQQHAGAAHKNTAAALGTGKPYNESIPCCA